MTSNVFKELRRCVHFWEIRTRQRLRCVVRFSRMQDREITASWWLCPRWHWDKSHTERDNCHTHVFLTPRPRVLPGPRKLQTRKVRVGYGSVNILPRHLNTYLLSAVVISCSQMPQYSRGISAEDVKHCQTNVRKGDTAATAITGIGIVPCWGKPQCEHHFSGAVIFACSKFAI